jgi:uncharacterized membrane protein
LLLVLGGFRLLLPRLAGQGSAGITLALILVVLVAGGFTLVTGSSSGLLLYPVLVNAVMFVFFGATLLRPPSAIEVLARLREPDLPAVAVAYTRRVTAVWTVFFAGNGAVALFTVTMDQYWWALYNGLIAYLLMGLLFGGEWLLRRRFRGGLHA